MVKGHFKHRKHSTQKISGLFSLLKKKIFLKKVFLYPAQASMMNPFERLEEPLC